MTNRITIMVKCEKCGGILSPPGLWNTEEHLLSSLRIIEMIRETLERHVCISQGELTAETLPGSLQAHRYTEGPGFCFACGFPHAEDYADCVWRKAL